MVILLITVALVTSVRLAIELARPLQDAYSRGHEIIRLEDQIDLAKLNNQKLIAENAYLKTKFGIEQEARRLGYVFPEERTLRLAGSLEPDPIEAGAPQSGPTATASVVHAGKALADQIRDTVRTFLAAGGRRRHKLQFGPCMASRGWYNAGCSNRVVVVEWFRRGSPGLSS